MGTFPRLAQLEVLALRHQLQVLQRSRPRRVRLAKPDRWLWVVLSRVLTGWRSALVIVKRENRHRLAPTRLPAVVDLEKADAGIGRRGGTCRHPCADSHDGAGESALGRAPDFMANC